jgi:hypothetical protein
VAVETAVLSSRFELLAQISLNQLQNDWNLPNPAISASPSKGSYWR